MKYELPVTLKACVTSYVVSVNLLFAYHPTDFSAKLYVNNRHQMSSGLSVKESHDLMKLKKALSRDSKKHDVLDFSYTLRHVDVSSGLIFLDEGSVWQANSWYQGILNTWKVGDHVKVYLQGRTNEEVKISNLTASNEVWAIQRRLPSTDRLIEKINYEKNEVQLVLKNGWELWSSNRDAVHRSGWQPNDRIFIFHKLAKQFELWNLDRGSVTSGWILSSLGQDSSEVNLDFDDVLELESRLNKRVLSQPDATKALAASIMNYCSGLKDPHTPVGVFLFLGPTGVGKTELAKALAEELYKDRHQIIRLDMSHFSEAHSVARLIGSPPGYINHNEGGQLTEAIKEKPQSVVLLDEIEKAHSAVHKIFLPVFDEGYITDAKDETVQCNQNVFIMTSNLCAKKITTLFNSGCDPQEVLNAIEPALVEALSPELYNRLEPIIFRPLESETIQALVDIMLNEVVDKLKTLKDMDLTIDPSVREYLIENGYCPKFGARPLKKLIQKKVLASLSFAIISQRIPEGSHLTLSYYAGEDAWNVDWKPTEESNS